MEEEIDQRAPEAAVWSSNTDNIITSPIIESTINGTTNSMPQKVTACGKLTLSPEDLKNEIQNCISQKQLLNIIAKYQNIMATLNTAKAKETETVISSLVAAVFLSTKFAEAEIAYQKSKNLAESSDGAGVEIVSQAQNHMDECNSKMTVANSKSREALKALSQNAYKVLEKIKNEFHSNVNGNGKNMTLSSLLSYLRKLKFISKGIGYWNTCL